VAEPGDQICLLQLKAFGDFVIANAAAERVAESDRHRLVLAIGEHLRPLRDAVEPSVRCIEIATGEPGVPAIYDVRKLGLAAAFGSALRVRSALARASLPENSIILMDRVGLRERWLIGGRKAAGMRVGTANIYHGYDELLRAAGLRVGTAARDRARPLRLAGIFPGSRIAAKNLPIPLVASVLRLAEERGVPTRLYLLEGERTDLEASGLPHVIVPRQFSALRQAIEAVDLVISADSLPAHFAESLRINNFVITPRPNEFWMPRSVFDHGRWALFDDPGLLAKVGALVTV
jgi:hypothetical protein